jgi:hypothetical protein
VVEHCKPPDIPPHLPLQLKDLLTACFRHKPEQRPSPVQLLRLLETVPLPKPDPPEARPRRPLTPVITEGDVGAAAAGSSAALRRSTSAAAAAVGSMPPPQAATNLRRSMRPSDDTSPDFAPVPRPLLKLPSMPPTAAAAGGAYPGHLTTGTEGLAHNSTMVSSTKRQKSSAAMLPMNAAVAAAPAAAAAALQPQVSGSPVKHVVRLPRLNTAPAGGRSRARQSAAEEPLLVPVAPLSAGLRKKQQALQALQSSRVQQQAAQEQQEAHSHTVLQAATFAAAEARHSLSQVAATSPDAIDSPKGVTATRMPRMPRRSNLSTRTSQQQQQQQQAPAQQSSRQQAGLPAPPAFLQSQPRQADAPAQPGVALQSLHHPLASASESDRLPAGPDSPRTLPPRAAEADTAGAARAAGERLYADQDQHQDQDAALAARSRSKQVRMSSSASQLLPEASDESLSSTRAMASNPNVDPALQEAAKYVTEAAELTQQGQLRDAEQQLRWVPRGAVVGVW